MDKLLNPGFLLINKPIGRTSFSIVAQIKRLLKEAGIKKPKVGHAGTLDPFATGLLLIAIGREATRCMTHLLKMNKTYRATIQFEMLTDTLDITGNIIQEKKGAPKSIDEIQHALTFFRQEYNQIPPLYSALKFQGKRLYHIARKKILFNNEQIAAILKKKQRLVSIYQSNVLDYKNKKAVIQVQVSHGTYIRSLMSDMAKKMGFLCTTIALERISIGLYENENALLIDQFEDWNVLQHNVITIENFLRNI